MTFDEILDQALEMLQRRGRLTYRALQRQFNLDDAYLPVYGWFTEEFDTADLQDAQARLDTLKA